MNFYLSSYNCKISATNTVLIYVITVQSHYLHNIKTKCNHEFNYHVDS